VGTGWLGIFNTSGTDGDSLTVTVSTGTLTPGTCTGRVVITDALGSAATVNVTFVVSAPDNPITSPDPASLSFQAYYGGPDPAPQAVTVNNAGTGPLNWTATVTQGMTWLSVSPTAGTQGETFTASVDVLTRGVGYHYGIITITGGGPAVYVNVSLLVVQRPRISPDRSSLTFNGYFGGPDPASQQVTINNTGGSTLLWTASKEGGAGWLSVDPDSGTDGASVAFRVTMMPVGTYTETVRFTDLEADPTFDDVAVTFVVEDPPVIQVSPARVSLSSYVGCLNPALAARLIETGGGMTLHGQAAADDGGAGWLFVSPESGAAGQTSTVSAVVGSMAAGNYPGAVTISDQGGIAADVVVPVSFTVEAAPIVAPFPTALGFSVEAEVNPPAQTITVNIVA